MKKTMMSLMVLVIICITACYTQAAVRVRGHFRSNGTYVMPHYRSNPDGNFYNNWSTYPNVNPYTGVIGTRRTPSYNYGQSYYPRVTLPRNPLIENPRVTLPRDPFVDYPRITMPRFDLLD